MRGRASWTPVADCASLDFVPKNDVTSELTSHEFVRKAYRELDQYVGAFADGLLNLLLIIGRPGVQKSQAVKAAVGRRAWDCDSSW